MVKDLKKTLEVFTDRFKANKQEDSQEFLRIIIEALHNDIASMGDNVLYDKPAQGPTEAWNRLIERETSHLFDIFGGLIESVLTCDECNNQSKVSLAVFLMILNI